MKRAKDFPDAFTVTPPMLRIIIGVGNGDDADRHFFEKTPASLRRPRCGEQLQPDRTRQGHPDDIEPLILDHGFIEEEALELESELAVDIEVANVAVHRVYVNLPELPDDENVVKKQESGALADSLTAHPWISHELPHFEFGGRGVNALRADGTDHVLLIKDPEVVARGCPEIAVQFGRRIGKTGLEAFPDGRFPQPT